MLSPSWLRLRLPDAVSSEGERLLSTTLVEPSIEQRKLLRISPTQSPYSNTCREKNARSCSKCSARRRALQSQLSQKRNINSVAGFVAVSHRRQCGNHRARIVDSGGKKRGWTPTANRRINDQSLLRQQRVRCNRRTGVNYHFPLSG